MRQGVDAKEVSRALVIADQAFEWGVPQQLDDVLSHDKTAQLLIEELCFQIGVEPDEMQICFLRCFMGAIFQAGMEYAGNNIAAPIDLHGRPQVHLTFSAEVH